ncbi:NupC/NupG family nucleoside CNT transporter [Aerococcus vaginalis]
MSGILRGVLGLVIIAALAWVMSMDRSKVKWKSSIILLVIMFVLAFVSLKTTVGITVLNGVSQFFTWLINQAGEGIAFVFGDNSFASGSFFFAVLMPMVFISALIGILQYTRILPYAAKGIGWVINKLTGMGEVESFMGIFTALLGQPNSYMAIKDKMDMLAPRQMFLISLFGMTSVSASTMGAYMQIVDGKYVVVAVLLNLFGTLLMGSFMAPYDADEFAIPLTVESNEIEKDGFFTVLGNYINDGFQLVLIISATVLGFVGLIALLNNTFISIIGISFTEILGYVFSPLAFIMGIPWEDAVSAGSVMATKLLSNEFVALSEFTPMMGSLSERTVAIMSTYVISFANLGTVGMIVGGLKGISQKQSKVIASDTLRLIGGSLLVSMLSGTIVGFFI